MNSIVFVFGQSIKFLSSPSIQVFSVCVFVVVCVKCVNKCVKVHYKVKIQGMDISCLQSKVRDSM